MHDNRFCPKIFLGESKQTEKSLFDVICQKFQTSITPDTDVRFAKNFYFVTSRNQAFFSWIKAILEVKYPLMCQFSSVNIHCRNQYPENRQNSER